MRVVVVGATGKTGDQLVRQLLEAGHAVTAFVRSPEKLGDLATRITIVQGDARNIESLERAVDGQDAVLSAFGPRSLGRDDLQEAYHRNLAAVMDKHNVSRLIELSAWGAGNSESTVSLGMKLSLKTILKNMYIDKNRGEAIIEASNLEYTFVRPGHLTDGPALGNVVATADGSGIKNSISRADVANFMIKQLDDASWIRKSPVIGYSKA